MCLDARLERLLEPLIADCGSTWEGTVTLFSTVPTSCRDGLVWCMPQKCAPALHNLCKSRSLVYVETRLRIISA